MIKLSQPKKTPTKILTPSKKKAALKPATKKASPKKVAVKKPPAKKKSAKKDAAPHPWLRNIGRLSFKIMLVVVAILLVIGIYLDTVVRNKMDGQIWDLPSVVYGRVLTLHSGQAMTLSDVRHELDALQYHKVATPQRMGEYSASATRIELIRRPFKFVDDPQPQQHVMLTFSGSRLTSIVDVTTKKALKTVKIEPKLLGMLGLTGNEQRIFMARDQFPPLLIDGLLTTEDRDFYQHEGVSPLAILRAMVVNLKAGHTVQGGSTLTQQLAKNLFLSRERSLWRKVREAYIAVIIDYRYSKDRILEAYLNEIYLGQNGAKEVHGFPLAARFYFGRSLEELRVDQLAMLVGMVKGPSQFNPWRHPDRTTKRRDLVLMLLLKHNYLTGAEYEQAVSEPLGIQKTPKIASRQPAYFRPGYAGFNRALDASRQIGSLAKPAVYLAALSQPQKFTLATTLSDSAIVLKGSKGTSWRPRNYDRKFRGQVPLYYALAHSLNVPTVNLGLKVGLGTVINTMAKLGVKRDEIPHLPSILLGAFSLSPFEVAQMFQSITNNGRKAPLFSLNAVVDSRGRVLYQHQSQIEQVVPEQAAWLTTYDMKKVVSQGTARFLQSKFSSAKLAGKTGTTDNNRDSWFAGADGREVGVVWVGRDDNTPVRLTGSSGALRVYADYLARRQPLPLNIGWPPYITTIKYQRAANGSLRFDCNGSVALPAWDKNGELKAQCHDNQPATWIKHMFAD